MMPNEKTVTLKLKRIDVCNLLLATTSLKHATKAERWGLLHDKLKQILDDFDEKNGLKNGGKEPRKATYTVLAKSGKEYKWSFTECEPDANDYGNGIYISIESPSGDCSLLDCRYAQKYDFDKMCVDYLIEYYGENLDELSRDD